MLPIIHPGPFELRAVQLGPELLDQMQRRLRGAAQARDVAGVRRDFRFNQDDVHSGFAAPVSSIMVGPRTGSTMKTRPERHSLFSPLSPVRSLFPNCERDLAASNPQDAEG